MEKKSIYVITETYLNSKDMSVETFVKGISEERNSAENLLKSLREVKIKLGYHESDFVIWGWGWTYKHIYGVIKAEIHLKYI